MKVACARLNHPYIATAYRLTADGASVVYVSDTVNDRVQYFDGSGNFLGSWGSPGHGAGQFDFNAGIALFPVNDYVYVGFLTVAGTFAEWRSSRLFSP